MRFDFFVLVTLFSLPTWSTHPSDDLFASQTIPKRLLKAGKSTSAPDATPPFVSGHDATFAYPHPVPLDTNTSYSIHISGSHDAENDDAPSPDETSQTTPRSLFTRAFKRASGGRPPSALQSSDAKRTTPRSPRGSPRTDSDSSPRSFVTTEIATLSSSSSEGLNEERVIQKDILPPTLPKGRRPKHTKLPLATPVTPKGLASATYSPRTPPSPVHQDAALLRTATPPLLLPTHEYREDEDDRTPTPPLLVRALQPMPVGEAIEAVVDFCVYQNAFFETMTTHSSVLMRRNVVHEHRLFDAVRTLPFDAVVADYKKNKIDLQTLEPHFLDLMTFFLYLTHNAREFEHRFIHRVEGLSAPSLEATMLLITRLHIFSLQHPRRIHNTYRALYQLCTDAQRATFEQMVRDYNASIDREYSDIPATSSSSSSTPSPSKVPSNLIYNAATFHETWQPDFSPPKSIRFLLGLGQEDQNKYFEPVKSNPAFFDVPGTSRVFATLLTCDSPFIGVLKSYHLERELRLGRRQESTLPCSVSSPTSSSSSSPEEMGRIQVARASSSDLPLRPRTSSAGAHFADGLRPQKSQDEHGDHRKHLLPHLPLHLPSIHLPSSLGALKLSPRGTHHITPRDKPAGPGHTPRTKKHADHILTKQASYTSVLSHGQQLSSEEYSTIREDDDAYPEIPLRKNGLTRVLSFRGTDPEHHVSFAAETDTTPPTQRGIDARSIDFRTALRTISEHSASGELEHTPRSIETKEKREKSGSKKSKSHKSKSDRRKKHTSRK